MDTRVENSPSRCNSRSRFEKKLVANTAALDLRRRHLEDSLEELQAERTILSQEAYQQRLSALRLEQRELQRDFSRTQDMLEQEFAEQNRH